ncbi:hypothetical protein An09g02943 [Aspergillus niger]|uniref:Uncharacterized protein n=2 Tax=Aspergillus niger TaxID=5061 RepID=A2QTQ7_ASPNC|nr:hypothetical protein An09g02943 [Aspergillus niger]CAK40232.1 hypothetical protein An09g02943 [Aspergillus niger]
MLFFLCASPHPVFCRERLVDSWSTLVPIPRPNTMSFGNSSLACRLGAEFSRSVRVYRNAIDVVGPAKNGGLHAGFSGEEEEGGQ